MFLLIEMSEGADEYVIKFWKAVTLTSAFICTGYGRMFCIAHKLNRQLV